MQESIANSLASIRAIQSAGGSVDYIAQDEPFVSGRERVCGGPALEPTADRVATYVAGVKAAFPKVAIGLIEAYPFSSADQIEAQVSLLQARGATPAFLHMDVDWHLSGADAFVRRHSTSRSASSSPVTTATRTRSTRWTRMASPSSLPARSKRGAGCPTS